MVAVPKVAPVGISMHETFPNFYHAFIEVCLIRTTLELCLRVCSEMWTFPNTLTTNYHTAEGLTRNIYDGFSSV